MIPIILYVILVVAEFTLILYSLYDTSNRLYGNIVMMFLAGILGAFLSSAIQSSVVYDENANVIASPSLGAFFLLVCTLAFVYAVLMVYEVIVEELEKQEPGVSEEPL